jgi:hypothetical protein
MSGAFEALKRPKIVLVLPASPTSLVMERASLPPSPNVPPVERLACDADIEGVPGVEARGYGGQVARPT